MITHSSFDLRKNKLVFYRGKDSKETVCNDLKENATKIINHEKKEMIALTDEENKSYKKQKVCYVCKRRFSTDNDNEKYHKVRDQCHYTGKYGGAAHSIYNLRYKTPKGISVVFHIGSTYDYHFIIKELAKEFEGQFECLGENTEKYITFSVPIKKELDNGKTITYKLKFIDSFRFMSTSLSKLADNLSEIYSKKCRDKNCKSECEFKGLKSNKLSYNCKECRKKTKKQNKQTKKQKAVKNNKWIN